MNSKFNPDLLRLYAITPDGAALDPGFRDRARQWLQAGVRAIQLRDKGLDPARLVAFGRYLRALTAEYGALLIVNDDPPLARLLQADGCHLGQDDAGVATARAILGPQAVIGLSTHDAEQVKAARKSGADYIGVGPIFRSPTKDVGHALLGPRFAGWATREAGVPVVAIGGVTRDNLPQLTSAGCLHAAVVSALNRTERPEAAVRALLEILRCADSTRSR